MSDNVVLKKDLNDMVKSLGFVREKKRWGNVLSFQVKLYNDFVLSISGTEVTNLYDLLNSYYRTGKTDIVKSKKLVEEARTVTVDNLLSDDQKEDRKTYYCVLFELSDGRVCRLFFDRWQDNVIIDNYYDAFKKQKKVVKSEV